MTEKEIQFFHTSLFVYLSALYYQDSEFRFRMRKQDDDRMKSYYWFTGNNDFLNTSFWAKDDTKHQTPRIRITWSFSEKRWTLQLVARDEDRERRVYFEKMATQFQLKKLNNEYIWEKQITSKMDAFSTLSHFIETEKKQIDKYLRTYPSTDAIDFIAAKDFDKDFDKIAKKRDSSFDTAIEKQLFQYLELYKFPQKRRLPYFVTFLGVSNYQGIKNLVSEDTEGEGIKPDAQWIFLTGENGFGKTSILRAIAKGLVGDENEVPFTDENAIILLNGFDKSTPFFDKVNPRYLSGHNIPVVGYGVSRFLISGGDKNSEDRNQRKTYSLFKDDGRLIDIEQELITTNAYNKPRFVALKKKLEFVLQNRIDILIDTDNGSPKVRYIEKEHLNGVENPKTKKYEAVSLTDLAAGYRSIFTMIGDMVIRFASQTEDSLVDLDDLAGIALIDEIDAHLHPKYQYELPNLLSKAFPKVQFIVTTHSPIPLLGLPENNKPVIFKVNRTFEEGITMDRQDDDFDIRQLNPEALLTSPIFDFPTLFARGARAKDIIPTSNFEEIIDVQNIKERLKKLREEGLIK